MASTKLRKLLSISNIIIIIMIIVLIARFRTPGDSLFVDVDVITGNWTNRLKASVHVSGFIDHQQAIAAKPLLMGIAVFSFNSPWPKILKSI